MNATNSPSSNLPISIKGIVLEDGKVWLRKNERDEWELPGGKLDPGEQPEQTIIRELEEELGFKTEIISLIQSHVHTIKEGLNVFVVTYLCKLLHKSGIFEIEGEAGTAEFESFTLEEVEILSMPSFYKESIRLTFKYTSSHHK